WFAVHGYDIQDGPLYVNAERGYGTVDYDYMDGVTFAHECAHIFGADHNDEDNVPDAGFRYGRGMRRSVCPLFCSGAWRTVMSYGGQPQIPYFSTPFREYSDDVLGDTYHNNVLIHNSSRNALLRSSG